MQATQSHESGLLTEQQAAERLAISRKTLQTWRCRRPDLLPFVRVGRAVRYRVADLDQFVLDNLVQQ